MFDTMAAVARDDEYRVFGEAVTVARSGSTSITPTMIRSEASSVGRDAGGVMVQVVSLSFQVKASDYTLGAPAHGDTITDAAGRLYDVQADEVEKLAETSEWNIPVIEVL